MTPIQSFHPLNFRCKIHTSFSLAFLITASGHKQEGDFDAKILGHHEEIPWLENLPIRLTYEDFIANKILAINTFISWRFQEAYLDSGKFDLIGRLTERKTEKEGKSSSQDLCFEVAHKEKQPVSLQVYKTYEHKMIPFNGATGQRRRDNSRDYEGLLSARWKYNLSLEPGENIGIFLNNFRCTQLLNNKRGEAEEQEVSAFQL